jgi:hypothetical protein
LGHGYQSEAGPLPPTSAPATEPPLSSNVLVGLQSLQCSVWALFTLNFEKSSIALAIAIKENDLVQNKKKEQKKKNKLN